MIPEATPDQKLENGSSLQGFGRPYPRAISFTIADGQLPSIPERVM